MLLASTAYTASLIAVPFPGQAKFIDGTLARRHSQCQASEDWAGLEPAVTHSGSNQKAKDVAACAPSRLSHAIRFVALPCVWQHVLVRTAYTCEPSGP